MKPHPALLACLAMLSCSDLGELPRYLEVTALSPAPNATNVDKAAIVMIHFNSPVHVSEAEKIHLRYVDDSAAVNYYAGCGLTPPEVTEICTGPFIWKPGRTVDVTIPSDLADIEGRTVRESVSYRFVIAEDVPFQLAASVPRNGDTVSVGAFGSTFGHLQFSDYLSLRDSTLTIEPEGIIHLLTVVFDYGRMMPTSGVAFVVSGLEVDRSYTIVVPGLISDYEGETLPQDYRIVFHTRP